MQDYCQGFGDCSEECMTAAQEIQPTLEACCDEMSDTLPPEAIAHCKTKVQTEPVLPNALECLPGNLPMSEDFNGGQIGGASGSADPFGSSNSLVAMPAIAVVLLAIGGILRRVSRNKSSITQQPLLA